MTTVQERLQQKRVPLDKWSIREQLCLASAVACSGDQNWMSVSRSLKMMCGTNRPSDWFSQKSCAAQYGKLLENAETPKRKKRTDKELSTWNTVETPSESILRKLTQERLAELSRLMQEEQRVFNRTRDEILIVKTTNDEAKLREMWQHIDAEQKQREKEEAQQAQWLKEREDRKIELERAWRPATHLFQSSSPSLSPAPSPLPISKSNSDDMDIEEIKTGTSPLLTSLLKSPSTSSTTPSSTGTTTSIVPSSRVVAPTITNLLTGSAKSNISTILTTAPVFPKLMLNPSLTGPPPYEHSIPQVAPMQSPSQAAPTLSMLLENKSRDAGSSKVTAIVEPATKPIAKAATVPDPVPEPEIKASVASPIKDEEQQMMDIINTMLPDNIDELADILTDNNAIIPEFLADEDESILESVELMAEQMESDAFEQAISPQESTMAETITTAELVEQLTSTSGFPIGPTPTVKGDANDTPEATIEDSPSDVTVILDTLNEDAEATSDGIKTVDEPVVEIDSKDDDQSDFSNDAPLSELFKDKSANSVEKAAVESVESGDNAVDGDVDEVVDSPKERADVFESDSNDDKCLEIIKREIHELSGLKENESSDNSNEATPKPTPSSTTNEEASPKPTTVTKAEEVASDLDVNLTEEPMELEEPVNNETESEKLTIEPEKVIETPVADSETDESVVDIKRPPRNLSTYSSDARSEDTKEDLPEEKPVKANPRILIEDTDDDESLIPQEPNKSKREYIRRKPETTATDMQRPDDIAHPDDLNKSSKIGSRMRLKDRNRSESPYVDDGDTDSTHSRSKRRYSSTAALDSMPNSPASSTEDNREYRAWKRSISVVINKLTLPRYSSVFQKPPGDDTNYKDIVLRPMELPTLKRSVEAGQVRTTAEFQRDIMLMFSNAIMYNGEEESTRLELRQLETDALRTIQSIMEPWRKEAEKGTSGASSSRAIVSPVPAASTSTSTPSSTSSSKPVRGRKSHRVSAGQQQQNN